MSRARFRPSSPSDTDEMREEQARALEEAHAARAADPFFQLMGAIEKDDVATIEALLDAGGIDLARRDGMDSTPLFRCLQYSSCKTEIAALLIRRGAPLSDRDQNTPWKNTALHYAVFKDSIELATLLIEQGALLDIQNARGELPFDMVQSVPMAAALLRCAISCGKPAIAAASLAGKFPDAAKLPDGLTALNIACKRGNAAWVRILNAEEAESLKAVEQAAIMAAKKILVLSTRFGAPSSHPAADPLAVSDYVKMRLEGMGSHVKCFNPNRDNTTLQGGDELFANGVWLKTWRTMLTHAQRTGGRVIRLDFVPAGQSAMQEAETDMARDKGVPVSVVQFAFEGSLGKEQKAALDDQLLAIDERDAAPSTALEDVVAAALLSTKGGDKEQAAELCVHALLELALAGETAMLRSLLNGGVDVNAVAYLETTFCGTALCHAAWRNEASALQLLLDVGADKNFVGTEPMMLAFAIDPTPPPPKQVTALTLAAEKGSEEALQLLLNYRIDRTHGALDTTCAEQMHLAAITSAKSGNVEVVRLLSESSYGLTAETRAAAVEAAVASVHPIVVRYLDSARADAMCAAHMESFRSTAANGGTIYTLSTRFEMPEGLHLPLESRACARMVKNELVARLPNSMVWNPNEDNAMVFSGDPIAANGAWLQSWLEILELSEQSGGWVVQLLFGAPSSMQRAEERMARLAGVPVVKVDFAHEYDGFENKVRRLVGLLWLGAEGVSVSVRSVPQHQTVDASESSVAQVLEEGFRRGRAEGGIRPAFSDLDLS